MAIYRSDVHPVQQAWTASGAINLELSPKPYTITELWVVCRASITTTSATNFNDYWDRLITRLNCTGAGKTFFDFSNLRAPYHMSRFAGFGTPRPTVVADSQTTLVNHFAYCFHFGIAPWKINPATGALYYDHWDLTAGIPPVESGNLTLGGTFSAAATVLGTNVTIADGDLDVYLFGVQPQAGDPPEAYMPRAYPIWTMRTPTPTATSSALATQDNVPAGDFLHSMLVMATNGTNAPRDDSVLNSFEIFNQLESRSVLKYGGQAGVVGDVKAAEIISQHGSLNAVNRHRSDNVTTAMTSVLSGGTPGVPSNAQGVDSGLYWIELAKYAKRGHPLYGVDLRRVATGDLQARYGVSDATGVTLDMLYRKYQLNPAHPLNAGM